VLFISLGLLIPATVLVIVFVRFFPGLHRHLWPFGDRPKASVKGTVTLDGMLLPFGRITFIPQKGHSISAEILGGKYEVEDLTISGEVKVLVSTSAWDVTRKLQNIRSLQNAWPEGPGGHRALNSPEGKRYLELLKSEMEKKRHYVYVPIPPHYGAENTTPLSFTPRKSEEQFDVQLVGP
jgi:hypothetical protein